MINKYTSEMALKEYWDSNEEFADFFNSYLFHGEHIFDARYLWNDDTNYAAYFGNIPYANNIVAKFSEQIKTHLILLNICNDEQPDYSVISFAKECELAAYSSQYEKDGHLYPVLLVLFYVVDENWTGPVTYLETLDVPEIYKTVIADYKIKIAEVKTYEGPLQNKNNADLINLFQIVLNDNDTDIRGKLEEYCRENNVLKRLKRQFACKMKSR